MDKPVPEWQTIPDFAAADDDGGGDGDGGETCQITTINIPAPSVAQAGCPSYHPTNRALKTNAGHYRHMSHTSDILNTHGKLIFVDKQRTSVPYCN